MQIIKIQGRRAEVTLSGRGYVTVRVPQLSVFVYLPMEPETKTKLSSDPEGWRQEMGRLESEALRLARVAVKEVLK